MVERKSTIRLSLEGAEIIRRDNAATAQSFTQVGAAADKAMEVAGKAADREAAKWKKMAEAGRAAYAADQAQARFNAMLGVGGGGKSARDSADVFAAGGLSRNAVASRVNLARQGADVFTMAAMGASPGMIAVSQGPQVLDAWRTAAIRLSPSLIAVGAAVTAVGAAALTGAVALDQHQKAMAQLDVAARGLGAASGLTAEGLNQQALAAAKAGDLTVAGARAMAASYAATGRIGGDVLGGLIRLTEDYAATVGQDAKAATQELGRAFADPAKGAAELNSRLNFLSTSELKHIENLARAGDAAGAQALMVDKLKGSLISANDATGFWAQGFQNLKNAASDALSAIGDVAARMAQMTADQTEYDQKTQALRFGENIGLRNWRPFGLPSVNDTLRSRIGELNGRWDFDGSQARNRADRDRQALIERYAPDSGKLDKLKAERKALLNNFGYDQDSLNALTALEAEIDAVGKGYSSAADMASKLKQAATESASAGRKAAQEAKQAEAERLRIAERLLDNKERLADLELSNRARVAELGGANGQVFADEQRRRALVKSYQEAGKGFGDALRLAQEQVDQEVAARAANDNQKALEKKLQGLTLALPPEGLISRDLELMAAKADAAAEGMDQLRWSGRYALDSIGDALARGEVSWKNWGDVAGSVARDLLASFTRLAFSNPLNNLLFGPDQQGRLLPTLAGTGIGRLIGFNANGTDNWRGGLSWVGERGPEIVNLPKGSQVIPNHRLGALGGVNVNIVINAQGAGPSETAAIVAEVRQLKAELPGIITGTVNDGVARRTIKVA